jgi:hypothetical protein
MTQTSTTIRAKYRARTHDASDEALLRQQLGQLAPLRLRPLEIPEAGGSYEIWVIVEFVGLAFVGGVIGHIGSKWYERLATGLRRFVEHKEAKAEYSEMQLTISYDDLDIVFTAVKSADLERLPDFAELVQGHLTLAPLANRPVTFLTIGLAREADTWCVPHAANGLEPDRRFWGVSFDTLRTISHVYDSETRLLSDQEVR